MVSLLHWNRVKPENGCVNMWSLYQGGLNFQLVFKQGFTVFENLLCCQLSSLIAIDVFVVVCFVFECETILKWHYSEII